MKYRYTKARDRYAASVIDILGALYTRLRGAPALRGRTARKR